MSGAWIWVRVGVTALRPLAWLWPTRLRTGSAERELVLEEVLAEAYVERGLPGLISRWVREIGDVLGVAARHRPVATRAALLGVALSGGALVLRAGPDEPRGALVVRAVDPAGEFTLTLERGRLVAASVDRIPYSADRLVQTTDSLRVLDAQGRVVVAVEFEAPGTIRWEPREAVGP
jgi:hypothetical protein